MKLIIFLGFVCLVAVQTVDGELCKADHACKLEELGCFDDQHQRALPEEILNERDASSKVYGGSMLDWNNYDVWLKGFACRCAKLASAKGYTVIGLQFYGECWSGPNAGETYDRYGKSEHCVDGNFRAYSNGSSCIKYIGKSWTNLVYRIANPACPQLQIEPIGCYHDNMVPPRPLPNYILNERDFTNKHWNGRLIDWGNWLTYSPQMICRCAEEASKKGDTYFAIQFWAECWSGTDANVKYNRNGGSNSCANEYFKACKCNSYNCVGKARTNYVYKLHGSVKCNL